MRILAICAGAAILMAVSGCATSTVYQPATTPGGPGWSEMPLEDRRVRISFRSGADASAAQAQDLALRRAAELTLYRGHDWFAVTDRVTEPASGGGGPRLSLGLGGGSFGGSSGVGGGVGVGFGGQSQTGWVATLEILMGDGARPESPDAYDARAVAQSLAGM